VSLSDTENQRYMCAGVLRGPVSWSTALC